MCLCPGFDVVCLSSLLATRRAPATDELCGSRLRALRPPPPPARVRAPLCALCSRCDPAEEIWYVHRGAPVQNLRPMH